MDCRLLAILEFFYGTRQQSEELGTSWVTEMREEMRFALLCYGSSKVRKYGAQSNDGSCMIFVVVHRLSGNL